MHILRTVLVTGLLVGVAAFAAGYYFGAGHIGSLPKFTLTQPLELQASPDAIGSLPTGTVLYRYRVGSDIATFIVFVKSQNLNALTPAPPNPDGYEIRPILGYLP